MKKTVLLFALSFVLVAFLNAQNDCTGNTNNNKVKKEVSVNHGKINQTGPSDCSKPDDFYRSGGFASLLVKDPGTKPVVTLGSVVPSPDMNIHPIFLRYDQGDRYGASGTRLCCSPPPPEYPRYNPAKDH